MLTSKKYSEINTFPMYQHSSSGIYDGKKMISTMATKNIKYLAMNLAIKVRDEA